MTERRLRGLGFKLLFYKCLETTPIPRLANGDSNNKRRQTHAQNGA